MSSPTKDNPDRRGDTGSLLLRGGTIVTMNRTREIVTGDVLVKGGLIHSVRRRGKQDPGPLPRGLRTLDVSGKVVFPGFVQPHIHLCQTLFRGLAEDRTLMPWLRDRIWILEAAHDPSSLRASALLGCLELLQGGTTAILSMETVHNTGAVFEAARQAGIRATIGKALMDRGSGVPAGLKETTAQALGETRRLIERYHLGDESQLRCALAPRFLLSCSDALLEEVRELSAEKGIPIHTHAAEELSSARAVRRREGISEIAFLDRSGLLGPRTSLVHCVHLPSRDIDRLRRTRTRVVHCPSSNLKLGSGVAPVPDLLARGVSVSLAADGAPCNNNLDIFTEMRHAGLMQRLPPRPRFLPPRRLVEMATIHGARALGLADRIGSIEEGKEADLAVLDLEQAHIAPDSDVYSALVFAARASDVVATIVKGEVLVERGKHVRLDEESIVAEGRRQAKRVQKRAGLAS